ncbi:MAG TPA: hypothetical protein PKY31_10820, partial [Spirochaetota bacterium]|nr:hypothetical protein [Spirochaetota bacterium]
LLLPAKAPSIAGSTGHIFPGSEVSSFKAAGKKFTVKLHAGARRPVEILVRVAKPGSYTINGSRVATETVLPETHIVRATIR